MCSRFRLDLEARISVSKKHRRGKRTSFPDRKEMFGLNIEPSWHVDWWAVECLGPAVVKAGQYKALEMVRRWLYLAGALIELEIQKHLENT